MYFVTLSTLTAVLLAGCGAVWAQGLCMLFLGALVLIRPPRHGMNKWLEYGLIALMLSGLFAFLPVGEIFKPEWRSSLEDTALIEFGPLVSIMPWSSLESYSLLLLGVIWVYFCFSQEITREARKHALWIIVTFIGFLGFMSFAQNMFTLKAEHLSDKVGFAVISDPVANSILFALGTLLALGMSVEAFHRRHLSVVLGLCCLLLSFSALVITAQREVIFLFFLGAFLWLTLRMRKSFIKNVKENKLHFLLGVLFIVVSFFLIDFQWYKAISNFFTSDWFLGLFALSPISAAWSVICEQCLLGAGIGNLPTMTHIYGDLAADAGEFLSVWIQFGLIGAIAFGLIAFGLWKRTNFSQFFVSKNARPSQLIAAICLVTFFVMTLFMSPMHSLGLGLFCILIAVLASDYYGVGNTPVLVPVAVFRGVSLFVMGVGALWIASDALDMPFHSDIARTHYRKHAINKLAKAEYQGAEEVLAKGISLDPLNPWWYFNLGICELKNGKEAHLVKENFSRAVALSPEKERVLFKEGIAWINSDIQETRRLWEEALGISHDIWRPIRQTCFRVDSCKPILSDLAHLDYDLKFAYMERISESEFLKLLTEDISKDPFLSMYRERDRRQLFERWAESRDSESFIEYAYEHKDFTEDPWYFISLAFGSQEKYEDALKLALENLETPTFPEFDWDRERSLFELIRDFYADSKDYATGIALLKQFVEKEDWSNAQLVVHELLSMPDAPDAVVYWSSVVFEKLGNLERGWDVRKDLLRQRNHAFLVGKF